MDCSSMVLPVRGGAEKAVAVGQNFQDPFGENMAFLFALRLKNPEDQVLLAEAAGPCNFQTARNAAQFCDVFLFEFSDGHVHLRREEWSGETRRREGAAENEAKAAPLQQLVPFKAVWIGEPERAARLAGRAACNRDLQKTKPEWTEPA